VNAFRKLNRQKKPIIAFLEGNEELPPYEVTDFANSLMDEYEVTSATPMNLISKKPDILVIAKPGKSFTETDKFQVDQYIMNGGKTLWLIDPVEVSADSLSKGLTTYAFPRDLNLGDMFFRYGVRLNYDLLQDVECARIKVNTAPPGQTPQFTLHPWYFNPILVPSDDCPVSKNLNGVKSDFVSSLDTVSTSEMVKREVVLSTTPYARRVKSPSSVSLRNIENPPARELFNEKFITTGVILEGNFTSVFKNRLVENLGYQTSGVLTESQFTKMAVFSDGDLIANPVNYLSNPPQVAPLGFDRATGITYGNKEFLLNIVSYLDDSKGIMQLRNRSLKMRPLDIVRLREDKTYWQWLNVLAPLLLIAIFGLIYNMLRRYRYARK
jgi:ABC-2 type transport system permease protein